MDRSDLYIPPKTHNSGAETWWAQVDFVIKYIQEDIAKKIERWHMAGCMAGTKCDQGRCDCEEMIKIARGKDD